MDKVTQVNIEGHNYAFLAGQAIEGTCASSAAAWTKIVTLAGGAGVVDGVLLAIDFTYGNTAGLDEPTPVFSNDGENFYWDDQLTDAVTLPPDTNYEIEFVSGEEYSLIEFPVISVNNQIFPVCDAKGHKRGGELWGDGDTIVLFFVDNKFFVMSSASGGGGGLTWDEIKASIADELGLTSQQYGGNAATATKSSIVIDSFNTSKEITITYAKSGQSSTSWLGSWNGYELGAIAPGNLTVGTAKHIPTSQPDNTNGAIWVS